MVGARDGGFMAANETAAGRADGFEGRLARARLWFVAGALASLLGFALPWFRVSRDYLWWYGGWQLLTANEPDLWWIALLFLGYAALIVGGALLPRLGPDGAGALT